jgi:hypothetical protein
MATELAAVVLQVIVSALPLGRQYSAVELGVVKAAEPLHQTATSVDAGTPVQVYAAALLVMVADAIWQVPAAVIAVPAEPNFTVPATTSFAADGSVVPMPTLPLSWILTFIDDMA